MVKKFRRSLHHAVQGTKNFIKGTPKATKQYIKEIPSSVKSFKTWISTFRGGITLLCLIGMYVFPIFTQNDYYLGVFISAMIFAIFAGSWVIF